MFLAAGAWWAVASEGGKGPFLEYPYLQLGNAPTLAGSESYELLWQTASAGGTWAVELKTGGDWKRMGAPRATPVAVPGAEAHVVMTALLTGLRPGAAFDYRVLLEGQPVFTAKGKARASRDQSYQFVAFGDSGADTNEQRKIAYQTSLLQPDFVFHTGDMVYTRGLVSEYRKKWFPQYNPDVASPQTGAPLLRSTVFLSCGGNHDLMTRNLGSHPDALPYFYYWSMPLNGPEHAMFAKLEGDAARIDAFKRAAGERFPRMVNYSFDWGNSHWLVLDTNTYADWSDPAMQEWVRKDLAGAKNATWKFVGLHHPGFNSSKAHFKDQQARVLSRIFEEEGVSVVFAGHVHNYQRSYPVRFQAASYDLKKTREVDGTWKLDKEYDGVKKTRPDGVIYLVTGAGGNSLYNKEQQDDHASWQEFTTQFVSKIHSLTEVKVQGKKLSFRQIDENGKTFDQFVITK
jgi:hypothetical protein